MCSSSSETMQNIAIFYFFFIVGMSKRSGRRAETLLTVGALLVNNEADWLIRHKAGMRKLSKMRRESEL